MTRPIAAACPVSVDAAAYIIARYLHEHFDQVHTHERDAFTANSHTMTDVDYSKTDVRLNGLFDLCVGLSRLEQLAKNTWEESSDDSSYEAYKEHVAFKCAGEHRESGLLNESYRGSCYEPPVEDNDPTTMFVRNLRSVLSQESTTTAETTKAEPTKAKAKKRTRTKKVKTKETKTKTKTKAKAKKAWTKKAKATKPKAKRKAMK